MRNIRILTFVIMIAILSLASCSNRKLVKLMQAGEVTRSQYKVTFPFEFKSGWIIIKVKIKGAEYDFLLDTGAPNVLSEELAKKLNLMPVGFVNVSDSQGRTRQQDFVRIDTIEIGSIDFIKTGAIVANLNVAPQIACMEFDGFIGSNLMKKSIWEIDFDKKIITITNSLQSLNIPAEAAKVPFTQKLSGAPQISISVNGYIESDVTVDLGSSSGLKLHRSTYDTLLKGSSINSSTYGYGVSGSGLFGGNDPDTITYAIIEEISFGDIVLKHQVVTFRKVKSHMIGTDILSNYRLIFNWFENELIMIEKAKSNNTRLAHHGYSAVFRDDKLYVGYIYDKSSAALNGLQINDQIIEINGQDCSTLSLQQYCATLNEDTDANIKMTVIREGKEILFDLSHTILLE